MCFSLKQASVQGFRFDEDDLDERKQESVIYVLSGAACSSFTARFSQKASRGSVCECRKSGVCAAVCIMVNLVVVVSCSRSL